MKALKKQLAAAIVMTLVAAIAVGSSTYAWFASNDSASADGMSVKAETEGGLLIGAWTYPSGEVNPKAPDSDSYKSSVSAAMSTTGVKLYPASVNKTDYTKWYWTVSDSQSDYTKSASASYTEMVVAEDSSTSEAKKVLNEVDGYRSWNRFTIKTIDGNSDVWIKSVKVEGKPSTKGDFYKSLRVAVKFGSGDLYTFAPYQTGTNSNYVYVTGTNSVASYSNTDKFYIGVDGNCKVPKDKVTTTGSGGTIVNTYIYFDGEDQACYTNMAIYGSSDTSGGKASLDAVKVSFEFTTKDPSKS